MFSSNPEVPSEHISQRDPPVQPPVPNWCQEKMEESTNLSLRFPPQREETTRYRSLGLEGLPSSEADDQSHPQCLFLCLAEPPKLERGTGSPEDEEPREQEEGEEKEVLPGEGGTPPTPCLLPWGGGEEPLLTRSCLLPLGGVPLPSPNWIFRGGAQGSVCLLEVWEEGLYPIPLSRHMEVVGRGLPLSRKAESRWDPLRSLERPPLS